MGASLAFTFWHIHQGMSADEIVANWPHLNHAGVYAALAYYYDRKDEIEAEIEADEAWYEEMKATAPSLVQEKLALVLGHLPAISTRS